MNKYPKRMREGSVSYRRGRLDQPFLREDLAPGLADIATYARKEYDRGKRDRARLQRKRRRDDAIVAICTVLIWIVTFLVLALYRALPWLVLAVFIKLLFFGGF